MTARCTFCSAALPAAPFGASVRCPSCGNLTSTPSMPPTTPGMPGYVPPVVTPPAMPFANVNVPKQGAAPPPTVVMPSRAGGVDELVGGGITILGIGIVKFFAVGFLVLGFTCVLSMIGLLFH